MRRSEELSKDKQYCYLQERSWGNRKPTILFIGLHATWYGVPNDSPMLLRCITLAKQWGYNRVMLCNLYALRVIEPHDLMDDMDTVGVDNDATMQILINNADVVVCTWGVNGHHGNRDKQVLDMIPMVKRYCIGTTRARNDPKMITSSTPTSTMLSMYKKRVAPPPKTPKTTMQDEVLDIMIIVQNGTAKDVHKYLPHIPYRGIQSALYKLAYNGKLTKLAGAYEMVTQTNQRPTTVTGKAEVVYDTITHYHSVDVFTLVNQIPNIGIAEIEQICNNLLLQKRIVVAGESPTQPIQGAKTFLYSVNPQKSKAGDRYVKAPRKLGMRLITNKKKKMAMLKRAIKRTVGGDQDLLINVLGDIESG